MELRDDFRNHPKIRRSSKNKNIHNLFIFNKSGICLYGKNFTNIYNFEENLVSSFFSALMSFTSEMMGDQIKTVEMSGIKFVIVQKEKFYYALLCHSIENLILLEDIVNKINLEILSYIESANITIDSEYFISSELDFKIDEIIEVTSANEFDLNKELKIIEFLKDLTFRDEFNGIILLTDKGKVIYSSLNGLDLKQFMKEVDFRAKIWNNNILKLFYTSKNNEIIFSEYLEDLYLVILIFDNETKFGVAEYYLHKVVDYIKKEINS